MGAQPSKETTTNGTINLLVASIGMHIEASWHDVYSITRDGQVLASPEYYQKQADLIVQLADLSADRARKFLEHFLPHLEKAALNRVHAELATRPK